ncbi:MAG TPA: LysR substrate-binding domain-containing protein [Mesorhizobium sp.]|jgi:DNA-binding transcriptional LysR family regulator|uniref:LysR substrate-binding domain-containing protein n=1 Tax=Mesorhizobium sp. TaxID=1871066 RepID=UPI002DDD69CC|nr:LysR substrate-binding domain-containing protein [Mesorhizobium sp.]HEV2506494.1 LysR substrate-binding domain-containing protein [Mesorhizobium sp.]
MVRRYYNLPSLIALAAFEAAARHLSLTKAAEELNVTVGAVSKQIRMLEEELGNPLFLRRHRALELTREGETMAAALKEGFERISSTFRQVKTSGGQSSVTIGCTMAMAHLWLMPRMSAFWGSHQDIAVDHVISDHPRGLDRPDIDLRLRYGNGEWPDELSARLYDDRIFAVASPAFAREHAVETLDDLAQLQLLSVEGMDWSWTTWADFFRELGCPNRRLNVRRFNSHVIALQAARSGQGAVLGWASLVRPLIESGDLVQLSAAEIAAPHSYFVTWSARRPLSRPAGLLRDWLLSLDD